MFIYLSVKSSYMFKKCCQTVGIASVLRTVRLSAKNVITS